MKPVDQTTFGYPDGNCFSACVASLLHLAVEAVPWFLGHDDWYRAFAEWLRPRGYYPVTVPWSEAWCPEGYYILGGQSPRHSHAVIARGRDVVHDPHPSRAGLDVREDCTMLVPLDPGVMRLDKGPPSMDRETEWLRIECARLRTLHEEARAEADALRPDATIHALRMGRVVDHGCSRDPARWDGSGAWPACATCGAVEGGECRGGEGP